MSSHGTHALRSLENDFDRLRISSARDVASALDELRASESVRTRANLLGRWALDFPSATSNLLGIVARDPDLSLELAPIILGAHLSEDDAVGSMVNEVLIQAFPRLQSPFLDAAADRDGVRAHVTVPAGIESVPAPDPSWLWPGDQPFPPPDTVEGAQARLNFRGLGAGPVDGNWNELTRRAFIRWQVLNGFEPTGELDENMIDALRYTFPDTPG